MSRFTKRVVEEPVIAEVPTSSEPKTALHVAIAALVVAVFALGVLFGYIAGQEPRHRYDWQYGYNQPMPYYDYGYGYGGYSDPGYGWDTPVTEPMPIEGDGGIGNSEEGYGYFQDGNDNGYTSTDEFLVEDDMEPVK